MVDQNFEGEVYYLEFEDEHGNKQVKSMPFLYMYKMKMPIMKVKMTRT